MAETLDGRGRRSGTGQPFHRLVIPHIRKACGLPRLAEYLRNAEWLTAPEIAVRLGVHKDTSKRFAREGMLRVERADDADQTLLEPRTVPLPRVPRREAIPRPPSMFPICVTRAEGAAVWEDADGRAHVDVGEVAQVDVRLLAAERVEAEVGHDQQRARNFRPTADRQQAGCEAA